ALQAKTMTYEDLIRIAVETGTDGIDMTVYWLPGTSDDYLLPLRRLAYKNRVEIYSIGTRVRLAQPTAELREQQLDELRKWLDIGNFRPPAVYEQIEMSIPYAVSTHVKTEVALDDGKTRAPFDLDRVFKMFAAHEFRGYMGLEYEASGDPATVVPGYLRRLKELAVKYSD